MCFSSFLYSNVFKDKKVQVATVCERLRSSKELFDPNIVKVVKDFDENALYFSRSSLVLISYVRAFQKAFSAHKKISIITFPIWLYVAVTGVVVYLMISPYYIIS